MDSNIKIEPTNCRHIFVRHYLAGGGPGVKTEQASHGRPER